MIANNSSTRMPLGPINVSWMITNRCNYNCQFCFGCYKDEELGYDEACKIVDELVEAGLKKISFAGGEPLLWPEMLRLIEYLKSKSVKTMLISNGELITAKHIEEFKKNLDWLNLPLEGSNPQMNRAMTRKKGHFGRVVDIAEKLRGSDVKLKINTVATKINIDNIPEMVSIIRQLGVKRWKIFQFYPVRGRSVVNKDLFSLDSSRFEQVRREVMNLMRDDKIMVVFENNKELEDSYFSISPSGLAYVSKDGKDVILGDLMNEEVEKIWKNDALDKTKYLERSRWFLK
ncbi:MAG: radical SAM protein [Candidatus Pacebacteria bacterium]|nr:radical SAM protein [Candidatus Paceibacterota bacterium]